MKNIIKAQCYQLKKEKLLMIICVAVLLMQLIMMFNFFEESPQYMCDEFILQNGLEIVVDIVGIVGIVVGKLCCQDFDDKTGSYELLFGHSRFQVYMARVLTSMLVAMVAAIFIVAVPVVIAVQVGGWYGLIPINEIVLRVILMFLVLIRVISVFAFLSFVIRNTLVVSGIGLVYSMGGTMICHISDRLDATWLGITNLYKLSQFDVFQVYETRVLERHFTFTGALTGGDIVGTVVASVIGSVVFLYLGYIFFLKEDLK